MIIINKTRSIKINTSNKEKKLNTFLNKQEKQLKLINQEIREQKYFNDWLLLF